MQIGSLERAEYHKRIALGLPVRSIKNTSKNPPWGYNFHPEDRDLFIPDILSLRTLKRALQAPANLDVKQILKWVKITCNREMPISTFYKMRNERTALEAIEKDDNERERLYRESLTPPEAFTPRKKAIKAQ